jgi:hypothetical protein
MSDLSTDARNHLLSYLSLRDCLRYSQVSKAGLMEALCHLKQRRTEQFCERKAYKLWPNPCKLVSVKDLPPHVVVPQGTEILVKPDNLDAWSFLHSVTERVEGLYRALPFSHPSKDMVKQLLQDLRRPSIPDIERNLSFVQCMDHLKALMNAHMLHETILARATIQCEPERVERGWAMTAHAANDDTLTVTLDQYLGDVLIACYLMGHSITGLVEGPSNLEKWIKDILQTEIHPLGGYRQWVFLHSTFLRNLAMTREGLTLYKMFPLCGWIRDQREFPLLWTESGRNYQNLMIQPPPCFLAERDNEDRAISAIIAQNHSQYWEHQSIINQFGPLGPAFRGRDRIRTVSMRIQSLAMAYLWRNMPHQMPLGVRLQQAGPGDAEVPSIRHWIMELARECNQTRPMTVHPPLVSIQKVDLAFVDAD